MHWSLEIPDPTPNAGRDSSLAFDPNGIPHIAHHELSDDAARSALRYVTKSGGTWYSEVADDTDLVGESPSIRVDSSGRVHVAYAPRGRVFTIPGGQPPPDPVNRGLRYSVREGGHWNLDVVPSPIPFWAAFPSLAQDAGDRPHISYSDEDYGGLYYAHWDGSAWRTELVDGKGAEWSAVTVDAAGNPHIAYARWAPTFLELYYARWNGNAWTFEKVGDAGFVVGNLAMEMDASDRPHIAWTDRNQGLMYAVREGAWHVESLGFRYGGVVALALYGTAPRIAYGLDSLYYGSRDGGSWSWEIVSATGDVGLGLYSGRRLAMDPDGVPHLAVVHDAGGASDLGYLSREPDAQLPRGDVVMSTDKPCYAPGEDVHITATGWAEVPSIGDFPRIFWAIANASGDPVFETGNLLTALGGFNGTLEGVWNQTYRLLRGTPTGPVPAGTYVIWFYELTPSDRTPPDWVIPAKIEIGDCGAEVEAEIDFDPNTLNPQSRGKWVTVYIELPRGFDPRDIDASTIRLNDVLVPVLDPKYGFVRDPAGYLVDHDGDGIWERMVKFDRAASIALLPPGTNPVRITGQLADGTSFAGWSDPVRVLHS